jgi:hypothetical protein
MIDSETIAPTRPAVPLSWFHIVTAIGAVKPAAVAPQDQQRAPSVRWRAGRHLSNWRGTTGPR